LAASNPPRDL